MVLELQLIKTKTDQLRTGQVWAVTCVCPQVPYMMCPVHGALALRAQRSPITQRPMGGTAAFGRPLPVVPLFQCRNGQTLRRPQVVRAIKWLAGQLRCDPMQFLGHSLQQGGATSAAAAGLSAETIQQLGGWHSDTWQRFIQFPMAELASRTATMARFPSRTVVPDSSGGSASSAGWMVGFSQTASYWTSKILPASTIPILMHGNVPLVLVSV